MTMPSERARSLVWAGAFLVELAKDESLPLAVRRAAVVIARHFPTTYDISYMARLPFPMVEIESPDEIAAWLKDYPHGPLRDSTRLAWPEEKRANLGRRKPVH
ncbi:BPSL0761 family protein [Rhodanobacter sp. 115]|uniref:BPSL0761 family protein n=1 Tax=Rhodanobacter sp. FW021-MT20 TaxID=1162282 RepID=UPI000260FCFA|nr:BPSL0761 family protein [Rhodanobacter sp. 115]EIL89198.1 hypothetical protein UU5_15980 [Rhodanobacter sp. 115]